MCLHYPLSTEVTLIKKHFSQSKTSIYTYIKYFFKLFLEKKIKIISF